MRTMNLVALAGTCLFGIAACAPSGSTAVDTSVDRAAIHAIDQAHVDAFNAGNIEAIVAGYADDAVVMPSGAPALVGHDAIRKYFTESIASAKAGGFTESLGDYSAGVSGDLGWTAGTSTETSSTGTVWVGKYVAIWKKTKDGNWLNIRDTWNDDAPSAPAQPPKK